MMKAPPYFEGVRAKAAGRWIQLEEDPPLAGPWHHLFNQIQSPRHVVSELLQNADDAGATEAAVEITDNVFHFTHNGEDFTAENLSSLCGFGYSNKRALHTIGFRGIGFKSTFSLGDRVHLMTPTLSLAFNRNRFTEPVWCDIAQKLPLTTIRVAIKDESRRRVLEMNLEEWVHSPASLLFFHHIRSLRIGDKEVRWEPQGSGPIPDSEWMSLSFGPEKKYLLIRSPNEDFPSEALDEIRQERMVPENDELTFPPCRVEIVLGLEGRLFVILPTGVNTRLPFACNAPFVQDPARLAIKDPEMSATNRWLLQRVGELAAKALLGWLNDEQQPSDQRAGAYNLLSDVDMEDSSLEGSCAAIIARAMDNVIGDSKFLLTEAGQLVLRKKCQAVPNILLDIWPHDQVVTFFTDNRQAILSRDVSAHNRDKLTKLGCVDIVTKTNVIRVLETKHLPCPESFHQLLKLWTYISNEVTQFKSEHTNVRIVPVHGRDVLYATAEVVRLGAKKLLNSEEDWNFIAQHMLALNQGWLQFIDEQRRYAEEHHDNAFKRWITQADDIIETLGLTPTSDVSTVLKHVADDFFGQNDHDTKDCIRLTQIAASLGAAVPAKFQFVTRDGVRVPVEDGIVVDVHNDLDTFVDQRLCRYHVLHDDYRVLHSCNEEQWQQWIKSERSRLFTFFPIKQVEESARGSDRLKEKLKARCAPFELPPYGLTKSSKYVIKDWDFSDDLWMVWRQLASIDKSFWAKLLVRIMEQPPFFWGERIKAEIHKETNRYLTRISGANVPSSWIVNFCTLPCLQDTRGTYRRPAELLLRTPETEPLLDVEPFIRAEHDTEVMRPLLKMLGVKQTPPGPDSILARLYALASTNDPPVDEVEKWYHRLDQMMNQCSTLDAEKLKTAFAKRRIILTEASQWENAAGVFLETDESEVPGVALVHPSVRDMALWHKVGVADRPTADLAIEWLKNLKSGESLSADVSRRVCVLLSCHPVLIWKETGHWLNLEGSWIPINDLKFSLTMQSPVLFKHLFQSIKHKTADLQKLSFEVCQQFPFSSLRPLSLCVEYRLEDHLPEQSKPQTKLWLKALGNGLRRIKLDDVDETRRVRDIANRLAVTSWQVAFGLHSVPYIDDTPAGMKRRIDVLWHDSLLYVVDHSPAKMAKTIAQELGRVFIRQDIVDAIMFCYDRPPDFVLEYLEENFNLISEQEAGTLPSTLTQPADAVPHNTYSTETGVDIGIAPAATNPVEHDATTLQDNNRDTAPQEEEPITESQDNNVVDGSEEEKHQRTIHHVAPKVEQPNIIERFSKARGFRKDKAGRFYHPDGSWLEKVSSNHPFPLEWRSARGELLQSYWPRDHCIAYDPLQIDAAVWQLCMEYPDKYSLILATTDGTPDEYSGKRLLALRDNGSLTLFPASYRLKYASQ